jgi:hypothetical protein
MWFEKRRFSNQYLLKTIVKITNFTKKLQLVMGFDEIFCILLIICENMQIGQILTKKS